VSVSSYRPLIAVVGYHLAPGRVTRWPEGGYGVPGPYIDALRRAGARTLIVNPGEDTEPAQILEPFDGLLLVGGGDVDPSRYGQERGPELYGMETDRDELEVGLVLAADRLALPTLCICRGMQVMNVAFGGTLHQHLPGMPGLLEHGVPLADTVSTHDVKVAAEGRLFATTKASRLSCSSHHHQGVDRLGTGLAANGWSPDGLVEGIERVVDDPYNEVWMLGVQWHPEDTAAEDPTQQALFDGLALLAKWFGSQARSGKREGRTREYGIVEYDPSWPLSFEEEAARIREALDEVAIRVDHVGSTSVPGLAAKPVIDIQVSVASMEPRGRYVEPLVEAGYRHALDPIEVDHEFLKKGYDDGTERMVNVHVCLAGSDWERRHLAFRDHLRAHPGDAETYASLKRRLAAEHPRDIYTYVDRKTEFIRSIEAKALAEA
jgi:putative glutamine amidotransferase